MLKNKINMLPEVLLWLTVIITPGVFIFWPLVYSEVTLNQTYTNVAIGFYYAFIFYGVLLFSFVVHRLVKYIRNMECIYERLDERITSLEGSAKKLELLASIGSILDEKIGALDLEIDALNEVLKEVKSQKSQRKPSADAPKARAVEA